MNGILKRTFQKVYSLPKCFFYQIIGHGCIKIYGLQRWERGVKIYFNGGYLEIGRLCNFRRGVQLHALNGGIIRVGENTVFNRNVSVTAMNKITVGNHVKIANNVVIVDHDHDYKNNNRGYKTGSVVIEDGVWIGANSVILRNTYIGANSVIAAGSVVKGIVPPKTIYGGKVATEIKNFETMDKTNDIQEKHE
ncbi:MAG: acyltransferase [Oscillospiraceae bacterium]|nr:acyltransferase [Oscillospiraceae bacterium]